MDALHPVVTERLLAAVRQVTLAFVPVEIAAVTVDAVVRQTHVVQVALLRATPVVQQANVVAEAAAAAEHVSDFLACCDVAEGDATVVEAAVVDVLRVAARLEVLVVAADANQHAAVAQAVVTADVQPVAVDVQPADAVADAVADANRLVVAKAAVAVA